MSVWDDVTSWAEKAKRAVAGPTQVAYEVASSSEDLENGNGGAGADQILSWARGAADRARQGVQKVQKAAEKATNADWTEQAKAWQDDLTSTIGKVQDAASHAGAKAGVGFTDNFKFAHQNAARVAESAKDRMGKVSEAAVKVGTNAGSGLHDKAKQAQQNATRAAGKVTDVATKAGEKATAGLKDGAKQAKQKANFVAGSAKAGLEKAGSGLASVSALAMSPGKLLQAGGIFMFGLMLVSFSLSFLPMLPINPSKFSLLFAFGSITMLGSVAWLSGPQAFLGTVIQKDKLPFSLSYGVGLLGTFWSTLIARSYVFTAVFAIMQAIGLLYFLASFVPGGTAVLNCCGRMTRQAARTIMRR